jgi:GAF domain-containing protein
MCSCRTAFANQAAVALENANLFAETRQRAVDLTQQTERLSLLNRVSTKLAQSLDVENIFEVALQESARALDVALRAARDV